MKLELVSSDFGVGSGDWVGRAEFTMPIKFNNMERYEFYYMGNARFSNKAYYIIHTIIYVNIYKRKKHK